MYGRYIMKIIQDLSEAQLKAFKILHPAKYRVYIKQKEQTEKEIKKQVAKEKVSTATNEKPKQIKYSTKINQAYAVARKKYPARLKPLYCQSCNKNKPAHRHHVVKIKKLVKRNIHLNPNKHLCVWLCLKCHEIVHGKQIKELSN